MICFSIKCCCFHSSQSLLYCGLSSGQVRVYCLLQSSLVEEISQHSGPVRCLASHQSLLASGGDDTDIVIWDTATNRRSARLRGHTDYVRDVAWHQVYPWLVSASDDCTVRIWNWLSKVLVTTVTGHQHWVTSLALHTSRDLFISASLDGSVRAWDFSRLRSRTCRAGTHTEVMTLLGTMDVVCEKILEDFSEEVVSVRLHPTRELLAVVCGREVRLYGLERWREVGRLVN